MALALASPTPISPPASGITRSQPLPSVRHSPARSLGSHGCFLSPVLVPSCRHPLPRPAGAPGPCCSAGQCWGSSHPARPMGDMVLVGGENSTVRPGQGPGPDWGEPVREGSGEQRYPTVTGHPCQTWAVQVNRRVWRQAAAGDTLSVVATALG